MHWLGKEIKLILEGLILVMMLDRTAFTTRNTLLVQDEYLLLIADFFVGTFSLVYIFLTLCGTSAQVGPRPSHF